MCLSTVYIEDGAERTKVADCITEVSVEGDFVTVTDILGSTTVLKGVIRNVDLIGNALVLEKR